MSAHNSPPDTSGGSNLSLIDCDFHQSYKSPDKVTQYLPPEYQEVGLSSIPNATHVSHAGRARPDALPEDGDWQQAGAHYGKIAEEHFDKHGMDYIFLNAQTGLNFNALHNREYSFEVAKAFNKFTMDEWLPKDERFVQSLCVPMETPEKSAEMIREMGDHPRIRQVLTQGVSGREPFGCPQYWPIYEACEEMGLPFSMHVATETEAATRPHTAAGYPNHYISFHNLLPQIYMGQLSSFIAEGVFVEFPDLKMVFIEGGYTWLPGFMWRMDNEWKAERSTVPWLEKAPSEYIRDHMRFTTQPTHMPEDPRQLIKVMEMLPADELLMFSSDYPHWDTDEPGHALPKGLPEETKERIYYKNAQEFYGLPDDPSELT